LQGKADLDGNKEITIEELGKYVSEKVMKESPKIGGLQQPEIHGNQKYVLVKY